MDDEVSSDAPRAEETPESEPLAFGFHPFWGFAGVFLGVLVLFAVAFVEARTLRDQPFVNAVFALGEAPEWADPITIHMRSVPAEAFPQVHKYINDLRDASQEASRDEIERLIDGTKILRTERIISAPLTQEQLEPLLGSGRLPVPGQPETLAGVHARLDEFSLDGQKFKVVGRLSRSVAGFHFAYLIPAHETWQSAFEGHPDAEAGWLDPKGYETLASLDDPADAVSDLDLSSRQVPIATNLVAAAISGLMFIAFFGLMAHLSVFQFLYRGPCGPLRPALRVILTWPKTVVSMHVLLYGGFFGAMLIAARLPLIQTWLMNMVRYEFQSGNLEYVGDAYASGNILHAAWATFFNNFVLQTLGLTILISLVIPMIGILKTLLSFVLVGFGMVPVWSGTVSTFTFHSITMTLELEAYIFACVCVFFFWVHLGAAVFKGQFGKRIKRSFAVLLSGTLLSGIMLAIAGLYEAVSLILAGHFG